MTMFSRTLKRHILLYIREGGYPVLSTNDASIFVKDRVMSAL